MDEKQVIKEFKLLLKRLAERDSMEYSMYDLEEMDGAYLLMVRICSFRSMFEIATIHKYYSKIKLNQLLKAKSKVLNT